MKIIGNMRKRLAMISDSPAENPSKIQAQNPQKTQTPQPLPTDSSSNDAKKVEGQQNFA